MKFKNLPVGATTDVDEQTALSGVNKLDEKAKSFLNRLFTGEIITNGRPKTKAHMVVKQIPYGFMATCTGCGMCRNAYCSSVQVKNKSNKNKKNKGIKSRKKDKQNSKGVIFDALSNKFYCLDCKSWSSLSFWAGT